MNRLPKTEFIYIKDMDSDHIWNILTGNYCNNELYLQTFIDELTLRMSLKIR